MRVLPANPFDTVATVAGDAMAASGDAA